MRNALVVLAVVAALACGTSSPPADAGPDATVDAPEEIDCSGVGCAMDPGCGQICTEVCGCCGCAYGTTCGVCDAGTD